MSSVDSGRGGQQMAAVSAGLERSEKEGLGRLLSCKLTSPCALKAAKKG